MNTITLLKERNNNIYITWNKEDNTTYYKILGMNNLFEYREIIKTTTNTLSLDKNKLKDYLNIKVDSIFFHNNEELVLNSTLPLKLNNSDIKKLIIKKIKSYKGITISFQHKEIFDKYILYEKSNTKITKIIETEDFQVSLSNYNKNNTYYVEAYNKEEDNYNLKAISDDFNLNITENFNNPNIFLSIIIPIYNSELFLSRCIDSVLLSSLKDYEILLINDGSNDSSLDIMNFYKDNYPNHIKCFSKENEGVSITRNKGIELSQGEYIAFIDNDDLVHPYMYQELLKSVKEDNTDIAIGKTYIRNDYNDHNICLDLDKNVTYTYPKMIEEYNNCTTNNIFFVAVWNKIIKASLLKMHPFPLSNYYEDTALTKMIYSYIEKFSFNKDAIYVWDKRIQKTVGTATTTYFKKKFPDPLFYQRHYRNAIFYAVEKGNPNRMEYLSYEAVKEAYYYLKKIDRINTSNDIKDLYNEYIIKTNEKFPLLKNKYIIKDIELKNYVNELLKEDI